MGFKKNLPTNYIKDGGIRTGSTVFSHILLVAWGLLALLSFFSNKNQKVLPANWSLLRARVDDIRP
jgi:hypothetical protein